MKVLRLTLDRDPSKILGEYESHLQLERALGTQAKYTRTRDGYLVVHPIAPGTPMRAEWVEKET